MNDAISSALALAPLALAQTPAIGATELGQWLLAAAAVAVIANQGMAFFKNILGGFARKRSAPDEASPTQESCDQKHAKVDARAEALRMEIKNDIKGIHTRIDAILAATSRLEGKTL